MSKLRKTRDQKIIADLKRQLQDRSAYTYVAKPKTAKSFPTSHPTPYKTGILSTDKAYIYYDLIKTGILTSAIVASELLLFYLAKNHLIKLPTIGF